MSNRIFIYLLTDSCMMHERWLYELHTRFSLTDSSPLHSRTFSCVVR